MAHTMIEHHLHRLRHRVEEVAGTGTSLAEGFVPLEDLAREILDALAAEDSVAARRLRAWVEDQETSFDRVSTLEKGLIRAAALEGLQERPLTAAELKRLARRSDLAMPGQLRVVYALTTQGDAVWDLVSAELLEPVAGAALPASLDPVVRALRTVAGGAHKELRSMHRLAAGEARHASLGFARLVIEEALSLLRAAEWPNFAPLVYVGQLLDDPFLADLDPEVHADLSARVCLYLAEHHAVGPGRGEHRHWLERAARWLGEGTGCPELRALFFEARAMHATSRGEVRRALRNLLRSNMLLSEARPVDRRAETLLRYALVLSRHPGAAGRAPLVLETALGWLHRLADDVRPGLRLRLLHFLAEIEVRGAFAKAVEDHPLERLAEDCFEPAEILAGARRWVESLGQHAVELRRAASFVRLADPLYERYGTPRLQVHRSWMIGRVLLVSTPELATLYLSQAHQGFERRPDFVRASQAQGDVMVCQALLGNGDVAAKMMQALRERRVRARDASGVLDDLSLLLHDPLPEALGRAHEDAVLGDVLGLGDGRGIEAVMRLTEPRDPPSR